MADIPIGILILVAVLAAFFGALLTAGETALLRTTRSKAQELADAGHRKANLVTQLVTQPGPATVAARRLHLLTDAVLAVCLTLISFAFLKSWWLALLIATAGITVISWTLIGLGPRRFARRFPVQTLSALSGILVSLSKVAFDFSNQNSQPNTEDQQLRPELAFSEDELRDMVDRISELEAIEETEREMIHSVFELGDTYTREVMVPRTAMITIEHDVPLRKAMSLFLHSGFSRIPVVRDSQDDVTGIVYLKDVVRRLHADPDAAEYAVERAARPAVFVPESKPVDELLRQMQREANHVAIVIDEYGGTAGLVTIEDALEEIVGELVDEHDRAEQEIEALAEGYYRVPARLSLHDLGEKLELRLDDDEVDSVGGLLAKALGKVPLPGQHAVSSGLYLEAERTQGRRKQLATVLVRVEDETAGEATETQKSDHSKAGTDSGDLADEGAETSSKITHREPDTKADMDARADINKNKPHTKKDAG